MKDELTLIEKYYPRTWDDVIMPEAVKQQLTGMQNRKGYRLLLYGTAGLGKSTSARLLSKDCNTMYLSGSNDFTVDVLRQKVMAFAAGMSVNNKQKNVVIDECERIRADLQDAFKMILDKATNVNFIFITNEVDKVIAPLRSRCTNIDYNFTGEHFEEFKRLYVKYIVDICNEQNIEYEKKGIGELYKKNFPDVRHALVNLQQIIDMGKTLNPESVRSCGDEAKQMVDLYELIEDRYIDPSALYTRLTAFSGNEGECLLALGEPYFKYLNDKNLHDKTLEAAVVVSKHCNVYNNTINKFVTLVSCITELRTLFR